MALLVHDPAYAGWVLGASHPTQGRRFINAARLISGLPSVTLAHPRMASREELQRVHTAEYVSSVLDQHRCAEWDGERADLAELATLFVGGTLTAVEALVYGQETIAIHLPGGKHHAQADQSSGFCVFADLAIAADVARAAGHRVAILDIDAHHGDGTEALCADVPEVMTFSVHQWGIFPGAGLADDPERFIYNEPLPAGSGDVHLRGAVDRFIDRANEFAPTLVFIAAGADGHADDPLSGLEYTVDGFRCAGRVVRAAFPRAPLLVTGAGGYRPDDATPAAWAALISGVLDG